MSDEMTPLEVAKVLGVGRLYVYELLGTGLLRGRQIMGRWLIKRTEVERYRLAHPRVGRTIRARRQREHVRADATQEVSRNAIASVL